HPSFSSSLPPPTTPPHTLSLHDALPIFFGTQLKMARLRSGSSALSSSNSEHARASNNAARSRSFSVLSRFFCPVFLASRVMSRRSEEHTFELQSRENLVCRLLLEKKKTI